MTTKTASLVNLSVYMFEDLLDLLDKDHAYAASALLQNSDISFGDAEYTLVRGTLIERLLYDAYDDAHVDRDDGGEEFLAARAAAMAVLPSLLQSPGSDPVLVAING